MAQMTQIFQPQMAQMTQIFTRIETALADLVPRQPVELAGAWSTQSRQTYASEAQLGSGAPPFLNVLDHRWSGSLTASGSITGIGFLTTPTEVHWVKAAQATPVLEISVSLHAYADFNTDRATFAAGFADVRLPGIAVRTDSVTPAELLTRSTSIATGRVTCVARAESASFYLLLLPSELVKFGRGRLWRLRDSLAATLAPDLRQLLTRRRAGTLPATPSAR
jgi:hypothetical protein